MNVGNEKHEQQPKWISDDIMVDILSRLPARCVMRFRRVSKHWCSLTHNPRFIDMHLRHAQRHTPSVLIEEIDSKYCFSEFHLYCFDDHGASILKAMTTIEKQKWWRTSYPCNGLICLIGNNDIIVLNLTTQESITIAKPSHMPERPWLSIALAFQPSTSKYKLVWGNTTYDDCYEKNIFRVELMTLGSNSWRFIGNMYSQVITSGLCVGGIVYYLIDVEDNEMVTGIVSLDLEDEKFREVTFPVSSECYATIYRYNLSELHGNLCLAHHCDSEYPRFEFDMDIWVLKDPANSLWVKEYKLFVPVVREEHHLARKFLTVYNGEPLTCLKDELSSRCGTDCEKDTFVLGVFTYMETLVTVKNFV